MSEEHHINFAENLLCSYFNECQKNEIYLLYLHFLLQIFIIVCEILM